MADRTTTRPTLRDERRRVRREAELPDGSVADFEDPIDLLGEGGGPRRTVPLWRGHPEGDK